MATTTQSTFHPMRGHIAEGVTVAMANGDTLLISSSMRGWVISLLDRGETLFIHSSAAHIADFIINYPR